MPDVLLAIGAENDCRDPLEHLSIFTCKKFLVKLQCAQDTVEIDGGRDAAQHCTCRIERLIRAGDDVRRFKEAQLHPLLVDAVEKHGAAFDLLRTADERFPFKD